MWLWVHSMGLSSSATVSYITKISVLGVSLYISGTRISKKTKIMLDQFRALFNKSLLSIIYFHTQFIIIYYLYR